MLGKLALQNVKRSMQDYGVYLLTVTIAFSLIYAFNLVLFSKEIKELSQSMGELSVMIGFVSVIVIFVIEWLVHYMNLFMLEKRSKELGTYMLLGISNQKISKMVMLENMIMGGASLLAGLIAGTFIYRILTLIIMNLFEVKSVVKAGISLPAILLTFLYVILIYAFSMLRMQKRLKKMKICDLIYAEKQNETAMVANKKNHWILCLGSTLVLALGCAVIYIIFQYTEYFSAPMLLIGLILIIGGLYGVYIGLAAFLIKIFLGKNERKFSKDHLFIYRNISAKLKTMSITLGTLAMLLTLTLTCIQSSMLFNNYFAASALNQCTFDAQIASEDTHKLAVGEQYIDKTRGIEERRQVLIYDLGQPALYDSFGLKGWADTDFAISFSDYAALRQMLGYRPAELGSGQYIIHANSEIKGMADAREAFPYTINGATLSLKEAYDEPLSQSGFIGSESVIVLPDELTDGLETSYIALMINTVEDTTDQDCWNLEKLCTGIEYKEGERLININTKGQAISSSRSAIIMFGFGLCYTGLIFICTAATILTVQQLSEASKYRFRYNILSKLGVPEKKIGKLIFKQLLIYFGIPLVLPIPLSIFLTLSISKSLPGRFAPSVLWGFLSWGVGVFLLVYVLYFAAACVGYRKSVL